MASTANGRNIIIHVNAFETYGSVVRNRTTASMSTYLADLVCLNLDNKLSKDAGNLLQKWAQDMTDKGHYTVTGISRRIAFAGLLLVVQPGLREEWMNTMSNQGGNDKTSMEVKQRRRYDPF